MDLIVVVGSEFGWLNAHEVFLQWITWSFKAQFCWGYLSLSCIRRETKQSTWSSSLKHFKCETSGHFRRFQDLTSWLRDHPPLPPFPLSWSRNRTRLELLDLSGYRMTSKFCKDLRFLFAAASKNHTGAVTFNSIAWLHLDFHVHLFPTASSSPAQSLKDLLTQNFTHLRHLSLRACRGLADVALRAVLRKLPRLRHLDLLEVSALRNLIHASASFSKFRFEMIWAFGLGFYLILFEFDFSPHLCVGFLFLDLYVSRLLGLLLLLLPRLLLCHTHLCHTIFVTHHLSHTTLWHTHTPSFTHTHLCHTIFVTHHLSHTTLWHTHTHHLSHTPSFRHIFVTHHLSHTTLWHTHTPSFTQSFVTPSLSLTIFHTHHLSDTSLSHTIFHTKLCHTPSFTHNFVTHDLSHQALSHTIFHTQLLSHTTSFTHNFFHTRLCQTQLCHTQSFTHTHNFVTHTHTPSFTQSFVTHHLSHKSLSHTIFHTKLCHTQLCHTPSFTPSFVTHNFVTHHLSHTTLWHTHTHHLSHTSLSHHLCHSPSFTHTIFQTHLCHTPSFTQSFVTHHLSHTTLSHTIFHTKLCYTQLCHTPSFTHDFVRHNFVTHTHTIFHTQLCDTHTYTIFHTDLCHTIFLTHHLSLHDFVTHLLSHTTLSPAQTHNIVVHNIVTRHLSHTIFVTHTHKHTIFHTPCLSHTHTQLFPYNCLTDRSSTISFVYLSFPIPLELLFLLLGRSWLVGLSGHLICLCHFSRTCLNLHSSTRQSCHGSAAAWAWDASAGQLGTEKFRSHRVKVWEFPCGSLWRGEATSAFGGQVRSFLAPILQGQRQCVGMDMHGFQIRWVRDKGSKRTSVCSWSQTYLLWHRQWRCRPSINSCFTHQVLEQLLLPELFAQPGEGQMRPAPLSFVVLAHCDIQARDQFDGWQRNPRMLINVEFLNWKMNIDEYSILRSVEGLSEDQLDFLWYPVNFRSKPLSLRNVGQMTSWAEHEQVFPRACASLRHLDLSGAMFRGLK